MKRVGRAHGMVRTYEMPWNPKPSSNSKFLNRMDSWPPTAGMFSKVQSKPTNHSKFTGKCGRPRCNGCHVPPCSKAKDKTKGSNRRRSNDVASNYKLSSWRVADGGPGLNRLRGSSATRILDYLASRDYMDGDDGYNDYDHDYDYDYDYDAPFRNSPPAETVPWPPVDPDTSEGCWSPPSPGLEIRDIASVFDDANDDDGFHTDRDGDEDDCDDDAMSFCDVGFVVELIEEGDYDWCLVKEI